MKKVWLYALLCILFPVMVQAQAAPIKTVLSVRPQLGVKVGMNFAQLDGTGWDGSYKGSILAGAYAGIRVKKFGVMVEGLYSLANYQTGTGFYGVYHSAFSNASDSLKKGTFRVSYLNIPLLAQFKFIPRVWFQIGPQYSVVMGVKDVDNLFNSSKYDAKDMYKNGELSGVLGVWIDLPAHLNFGARYIFGLSNLNSTSAAGAWQQKTLQLNLGFHFL